MSSLQLYSAQSLCLQARTSMRRQRTQLTVVAIRKRDLTNKWLCVIWQMRMLCPKTEEKGSVSYWLPFEREVVFVSTPYQCNLIARMMALAMLT